LVAAGARLTFHQGNSGPVHVKIAGDIGSIDIEKTQATVPELNKQQEAEQNSRQRFTAGLQGSPTGFAIATCHQITFTFGRRA
jgi:hypothetical protein